MIKRGDPQAEEFKKPDKKAITGWRIGELIGFVIVTAIVVAAFAITISKKWNGDFFAMWEGKGDSTGRIAVLAALALAVVYFVIAVIIMPKLEYMQWGYMVTEDKVVIRHGIFFVRKSIIPIIRIQNITVKQGPVNRKLGLFKVEMVLASGTFEIEGLTKEVADEISDNLKTRLYSRVAEKGVL